MPEAVKAEFRFLAYRISDFSFALQEGVKDIEASLQLDPNLEYSRSDDGCHVGVLSLSAKIRRRKGKKVVLKLDATIKGKFEAPESMEAETFESFCYNNGTATLIPLLRATIMSFSSQAGMNPPIRIPLINVPKTFSRNDKAEDKSQSEE